MAPIPKVLTGVFVAIFVIAFFILYLLSRPAVQKTAKGVVVSKEFQAAHVEKENRFSSWRSIAQLQSGPTETSVQKPDRYILTIEFQDGTKRQATYPTLKDRGEKINVGQELDLVYVERHIPFIINSLIIISIK